MDAQHVTPTGGKGSRRWTFALAALALACGGAAWAQVVSVPAAHLNHAEGSVAYAPQGDTEWQDVQPRRVLKRGDRLWTDRGSRAELQAAGHALRMDSQTQLILENVVENATQLSLTQGSVVVSVTRMQPGDSFEIGTPNLAFRARAVGDYRIDVDGKRGVTRVAVLSGAGVVYGEKGEAMELRNGQRAIFRERNLARGPQAAFAATDDFDRWAGARRRGEPTVSMPSVAHAAPATPPTTTLVNQGRDIIISGPASSLPGSRLSAKAPVAPSVPVAPGPLARAKMSPAQLAAPAPVAPAPAAQPQVARAQPIPNVQMGPSGAAAAPLRVTAPGTAAQAAQADAARAAAQARAKAETQAQAQAEAAARAQAAAAEKQEKAAQARAREQHQEQKRLAAKRAEEEQERLEQRAAARAEQQRRVAAAEARRSDERRRAIAEKKADEERRIALSRREADQKQEQKRAAAARRDEEKRAAAAAVRKAAEDKRLAQVRKAEEARRIAQARKDEERRIALARKAEEARLADARRQQLARLQEQAGREEQSVQARRAQQAREAEDKRQRELQSRLEQAREEELRQQRAQAAEQARRDREEVWLRQQQVNPPRPQPLGIPIRRVS